jgi:type IV pilus assembly PilN-like protein
MALPQQVIDRLTREPAGTPGWAFNMVLFGGGIFGVAMVIYLGITFAYLPYINSQISSLQTQINTTASMISPADQTNLATFYSEIKNVQSTLANHVIFSRFLSWLETNTEANVYYSGATFSSQSGNKISLVGVGQNEADVNQQMAIFEAAPAIKAVSLSSVSFESATGVWQFNVTLTVDPTAVLRLSSS